MLFSMVPGNVAFATEAAGTEKQVTEAVVETNGLDTEDTSGELSEEETITEVEDSEEPDDSEETEGELEIPEVEEDSDSDEDAGDEIDEDDISVKKSLKICGFTKSSVRTFAAVRNYSTIESDAESLFGHSYGTGSGQYVCASYVAAVLKKHTDTGIESGVKNAVSGGSVARVEDLITYMEGSSKYKRVCSVVGNTKYTDKTASKTKELAAKAASDAGNKAHTKLYSLMKSGTIKGGDIIAYTDGSSYGHIAILSKYAVESTANANKYTVAVFHASGSAYPSGYGFADWSLGGGSTVSTKSLESLDDAIETMSEGSGRKGFIIYRAVGKADLKKTSSDTGISNNGTGYTFKDIKYGLYNNKSCAESNLVTTMTLNAKGETDAVSVEPGTYYFKEISSNDYYKTSSTVKSVTVTAGSTKTVTMQDTPETGSINVKKVSAGNAPNCSLYSLAGAEYSVLDSDMKEVGHVTTDANGNTPAASGLAFGTYYVKETKASPGFKLDDCSKGTIDEMHKVTISPSNKNATVTCTEPWQGDPLSITIEKQGSDGTNANLAGAVFRISHYGAYYNTAAELAGKTPTATWFVQTKWIDGKAQMEFRQASKYLAADYTSSPFYLSEDNEICFPLGTVTVEEIKAPNGFVLDGATAKIGNANMSGNLYIAHETFDEATQTTLLSFLGTNGETNISVTNRSLSVTNQPDRVDISFVKKDYKTDKTMAGIPFKITDTVTKESHIIVTDKNGKASTLNSFCAHSDNTNGNDKAQTYDNLPVTGIWFAGTGKEAVDNTKGALPGGTEYVMEELPCEANKGKQLIEPYKFTPSGQTMDLGTITNVPVPSIRTKAWDKETGQQMSAAGKDVTIVDTVSYNYLTAGKTYTSKGIFMDKDAYEKDGSIIPLKDKEGNYIRANKTFTVDKEFKQSNQEKCGTVDVEYQLNAETLDGKAYVIFEYLYNGESKDLIEVNEDGTVNEDGIIIDRDGNGVKHTDPEDADQTGLFAGISTSAWTKETGINSVAASGNLEITDTVFYKGIAKDKEYTLKASLAYLEEETKDDKKETVEKQVLDKNGKPVTAGKTFVPVDTKGEVDVEFPAFDASGFKGKKIVVYEELYLGDVLIASHKDSSDTDQTIYFPEIKTTARDSVTEDHYSLAGREVSIIDTVKYNNLAAGKEYTISGKLMNQTDGKPLLDAAGKEITASATFTPEKTDGEVEVVFKFDGSLLAGSVTVAFESLEYNGVRIAVHEDIKDEAQTIRFPGIKTSLRDAETGIKNTFIDNEVTLIDTVTYTNLKKGCKYRLSGYLMKKQTNVPVLVNGEKVTGSAEFTAEGETGTVDVTYQFDGTKSDLISKEGQPSNIVCFETLTVAQDYAETGHYETVTKDAYDEKTYETKMVCNQCGMVISTLSDEEFEAHTKEHGEYTETVTEGETIHHDAETTEEYVVDSEAVTKDIVVAVHEDINDVDQTVTVPRGNTIAREKESGSHTAFPGEKVTILDSVYYSGLVVGKEYTIKGQLYVKPENVTDKTVPEPLLADDKPVTADTTFTASSESGEITLEFTFNASALQGKSVVAFEDCYHDSKLVFTHADLTDADQTVNFPKIGTTAKDKDGSKTLPAGRSVTLVDTVEYENLTPGENYVVYGKIMDKSTEKAAVSKGKEITAKAEFTPEKANGTVDVTFEFSTSGMANCDLVAFEDVRTKDSNVSVAVHEDINDKGQTVTVTDAPKTGDITLFTWFVAIAVISVAGIGIVLYRKRKNSRMYE